MTSRSASWMLAGACAAALLVGCTAGSPTDQRGRTAPSGASTTGATTSEAGPALVVDTVASGLANPWDLAFLPDGKVLVTERAGRLRLLSSARPGASSSVVKADFSDLHPRGEGGLMGMLLSPDFARTRSFVTCQTHSATDGNDIRLVRWKLSDDERSAARVGSVLTGLPVAASGRHSGCRMVIGQDGMLYVGTGDTANATVPQDLTSLGGKVLRLDPTTGQAPPDNPFANSSSPRQRLVWTFGHRNVQGIAERAGRIYTAEHGPDKNDEINLLRKGGNYGWDPSKGGTTSSYDEQVPMTDLARFPNAVAAVWSSGETTQAVCAVTFLTGSQWGAFDGALAITALKGAKLILLRLDPSGTKVSSVTIPKPVDGQFGRLRAARQGPDGFLYVTTSNGVNDKVLRISPSVTG